MKNLKSKTQLLLLLLLFCCSLSIALQKTGKRDRIEEARRKYISEKLVLQEEQAAKFWPLYREFTKKRKPIRKKMRSLRQIPSDTTEEGQRKNLYMILQLKQNELDIEKEYLDKFLTVISAKQVAELVKAEKEFLKLLRKKLSED